MEQPANILVVDGNATSRSHVIDNLRRYGFQATSAASISEADRVLMREHIDLIVLEAMLPGEGGLAYCQRLRSSTRLPIIFLSALTEDADRILGLEVGADDYLTKPHNPRELLARIHAVLRRHPPIVPGDTHHQASCYRFGQFLLDVESRSLVDDNRAPIALTSGEYTLLQILVENAPRAMSRNQLLDLTRGSSANPFDRSIDAQVSRLRRKLEPNPRHPAFIKTIRNLGYAFTGKVERVQA